MFSFELAKSDMYSNWLVETICLCSEESFGGDTVGGGSNPDGGGQFGSAGGGNSIEGTGGRGDGSGGGGGGLGGSSAFGAGPVDLDASAGPDPGSPTLGQVLSVLQNTATIASTLTGGPWNAAASGIALAAAAVNISGPALGSLLSNDPDMAGQQLAGLGGASN